MKITIKGAGLIGGNLVYHGRQGACRNAGLRHIRQLVETTDDPLLRLEYTREIDRDAREVALNRRLREERRVERETGIPRPAFQA